MNPYQFEEAAALKRVPPFVKALRLRAELGTVDKAVDGFAAVERFLNKLSELDLRNHFLLAGGYGVGSKLQGSCGMLNVRRIAPPIPPPSERIASAQATAEVAGSCCKGNDGANTNGMRLLRLARCVERLDHVSSQNECVNTLQESKI